MEERTKLSKSSISEWDNGSREPSLSQLLQLGRVYHQSTSFFLEDGDLPSDVVLWRAKPPEHAADTEQQLIQLADQYHILEQCCGNPQPENLASGYQPNVPFTYADAQVEIIDFDS